MSFFDTIELLTPLSAPKVGRQYLEALPEPTYELLGETGICIAVGYPHRAIVYRGHWDHRKQSGEWSFLYHHVVP